MATSSIFANVKITDPKKAEAFINALDAWVTDPKTKAPATKHAFVTDANEIRRMMAKRIARK